MYIDLSLYSALHKSLKIFSFKRSPILSLAKNPRNPAKSPPPQSSYITPVILYYIYYISHTPTTYSI